VIGKSGDPISRISQAHADRVEVRGRDLTGDVMGRLSFTEYFHLLLTGEEPNSLQGAVAAGILGCGPVILGTAEACARLLERGREHDPAELAGEIRAAGEKLPGFGHPVHKPLDPRAERILELADEHGVSGDYVALARAFRDAAAEAWGRPLTMNVSMPIAAVMLDLGFPVATVKAVPILARTAGLLAHLAEERERPLGFLMAGAAEDAIRYAGP
jgi:citrate synthase